MEEKKELTAGEAFAMVFFMFIIGLVSLTYGLSYLFVPGHDLASIALILGLLFTFIGILGLASFSPQGEKCIEEQQSVTEKGK